MGLHEPAIIFRKSQLKVSESCDIKLVIENFLCFSSSASNAEGFWMSFSYAAGVKLGRADEISTNVTDGSIIAQ